MRGCTNTGTAVYPFGNNSADGRRLVDIFTPTVVLLPPSWHGCDPAGTQPGSPGHCIKCKPTSSGNVRAHIAVIYEHSSCSFSFSACSTNAVQVLPRVHMGGACGQGLWGRPYMAATDTA
eukprot:363718-Chlamydomonas_euryale.AAC.2